MMSVPSTVPSKPPSLMASSRQIISNDDADEQRHEQPRRPRASAFHRMNPGIQGGQLNKR